MCHAKCAFCGADLPKGFHLEQNQTFCGVDCACDYFDEVDDVIEELDAERDDLGHIDYDEERWLEAILEGDDDGLTEQPIDEEFPW